MCKEAEASGTPTPPRVELTFGKSTSPYFSDALKLAIELGTGELPQDGHAYLVTQNVNAENMDNLRTFWRLYDMIKNWKSARYKIYGLSKDYDIQSVCLGLESVARCYRARSEKPDALKDQHCARQDSYSAQSSSFGCVQLTTVGRETKPYYDHSGWYEFGVLSQDGKRFHVDKKAILETVLHDAARSVCSVCPAFSASRCTKLVDELPDEIDLENNSVFSLRQSDFGDGKPVGIKLKSGNSAMEIVSHAGISINVQKMIGHVASEFERDPQNRSIGRYVPDTSYSDIAGQSKAVSEVRSVVELPLTHPEYFRSLGVEPQAGVILYGPPGNGKTLLCKAIAGESKAHLEIVNGPSMLSKWHGESENNIRKTFQRALAFAPSILLFDEIDAIAPDRTTTNIQQHEVSIVSQLLVCLDGMFERGKVVVIATTNRLDALDPAIRRPGRFDYFVELPNPDTCGIVEILECHTRRMKIGEGVELTAIAERLTGMSGAEIAALCREAGMKAIQRGIAQDIGHSELLVTGYDFEVAIHALRIKRSQPSD